MVDKEGYHLRKFTSDDYDHVLATPLIQVFSVRVVTRFDDDEPSQIYGSIRVLEESYPRFILYHRNPDDSKTETESESEYGTTLPLNGPDDGVMIPSLSTILKIHLSDRRRGVVVVDGHLDFDTVNEDSYDRLVEYVIDGPHGYVVINYVVFTFAVYATIQVKVTKTDNDGNNLHAADIYGTIVAGYDNARMFCNADDNVNLLQTRLFDKPLDKPLSVLLGTPIKLSRNVVVVPVYASLVIKVDLCDSNGKIIGVLDFPAFKDCKHVLSFQTNNTRVEVGVGWKHAYYYYYKDRFVEDFNKQEH